MLTRPLLIGRGPWAQKLYTALPPGVNATISGSMTCMEDIREARARGNDCVIIASRTDSHCELLKAAFAAQLPVFCEKPMVLSTHEAAAVEFHWRAAGEPPFLCDFVHLWTVGFDYAWPRYRLHDGAITVGAGNIPAPKLVCVFGGDVQREDIHPVWDYGCHGVAMALMLGYNLQGLTMSRCEDCEHEWTLHNENVRIHVHAYPNGNILPGKMARAVMADVFQYSEDSDGPGRAGWLFYGDGGSLDGSTKYLNSDSPPLQRALKFFLNPDKSAWRSSTPSRDGMWLPMQVTRVLEAVCPPNSPFGKTP